MEREEALKLIDKHKNALIRSLNDKPALWYVKCHEKG